MSNALDCNEYLYSGNITNATNSFKILLRWGRNKDQKHEYVLDHNNKTFNKWPEKCYYHLSLIYRLRSGSFVLYFNSIQWEAEDSKFEANLKLMKTGQSLAPSGHADPSCTVFILPHFLMLCPTKPSSPYLQSKLRCSFYRRYKSLPRNWSLTTLPYVPSIYYY